MPQASPTTTRHRDTAGWVVLVASVAGAMVVALDGTVLLLAQPVLGRELGASVAQVQWTSTAYLLMVASLLVLAGRLGDRYGHGRLLWVGSLGFGVVSAGLLVAPTIGWVIALRALQGIFAALLQPATLALLRIAYPPDRLRRAIGIRTSAIGLAAAAGPLLGGILVARFGWRAVFAINLPVALLIVVLALLLRVPAPAVPPDLRVNLLGATLLAWPLAALVYTVAGLQEHGSGETTIGTLLVIAGAASFVVHEHRTEQPFIPSSVAGSRPVMASMSLLLIVTSGMFGALFVATFRLQQTLTPLAAGLHVLPLTIVMVAGAPFAGNAVLRYGARWTAVAGTILVAVGIATSPQSNVIGSLGFAVLGAGFAVVMVTATGTVVGDAPAGCAGVVGGIKQTAMNIGPTLGIAVASGLADAAAGAGAATGGAAAAGATAASAVLAAISLVALIPATLLPPAGSR
ncbi:putative MFS family arabinose efflux permease [Kribbella voronezhensis]|uniref:Putative MFS family arabinose efflux permease n=1 Tax=Kribbella voronezhensis TaxID=2512212 RepID=A0A4R7TBT8_9ACTN|nr:MFS transporter [Kribbella voronezhensis]TDU88747.1 putative MFS family arabinose efflux permease [Kribbella voronezhensis]